MVKTDYLGFHDRKYKELRKDKQDSWVDLEDKKSMVSIVNTLLLEQDINAPASVLEIGCGDAEMVLSLAKQGFIGSGIDISPTGIDWARDKASQRGLEIDFVVGDVCSLPFEDNSFDVVIDSLCLHCIVGSDRQKVLREVHRVLADDGVFIGFTMCNRVPKEMLKFYDEGTSDIIINGVAGRHIGSDKDIIAELENSGFTVIKQHIELDEENSDELIYLVKPK